MSVNEWITLPALITEKFLTQSKKYTKLEALTHLLQPYQDFKTRETFNRGALATSFGWTDKALTQFLDDLTRAGLLTTIYAGDLIEITVHDQATYKTDHLGKRIKEVSPREMYAIGQTWEGPPNPRLVPPNARIAFLDDGRFQIVPDPLVTVPTENESDWNVRMTRSEWRRLCESWGEAEATFLACQLQDYSMQQPRKFQKYKSHYLTLQNWRRRKVEENYEFVPDHKNGPGYYRNYSRNGYAA